MSETDILTVEHLFSWYGKGRARRQILNDVSFSLKAGEVLGIVGESGSGKSTLVKCILDMVREKQGSIDIRVSHPQMVFQDPYGSLNPTKTIGWILEEPLRVNRVGTKNSRRDRVMEMLELVGLEAEYYYTRKPSQLSGGQRQRVAIASALIGGSKLIVLDEPVSALDVTMQAQILQLLVNLKEKLGLSYLFISHDLSVVYQICDHVIVLYRGNIVESGDVDTVYDCPRHDYTKKLLAASLSFE